VSHNISEEEYAAKVQSQIDQYVDEAIHDLPEIFHLWSHNYIRPGMVDVFGVDRIDELYAQAAAESTNGFAEYCSILSAGCGDGATEIQLAKTLLDRNVRNFRITAVDISPVLIERFNHSISIEGLTDYIEPVVGDLNRTTAFKEFQMVMANHSLHHMTDLELVFDTIHRCLSTNGIFATCDMIGRNGHMRWPEAEVFLQYLWPMLSERQKFHHQLRRLDLERFVDHDCSTEGFEGIRAQDILPIIERQFKPYKFFGYGGFIDVLVDRGYGRGFDIESDHDKTFITAMANINDALLDAGVQKPTTMMAYFTKYDRGEKFYRNRSMTRSIRDPNEQVEWALPHLTA
jgi:2-polyprenyl-3-methyl-5-hydroxy-6-metoxy-1,4-benzoquinol methylase